MRRFGEFIDDEEDDAAAPAVQTGDTVTDAPPMAPPPPVSTSPVRFQKLQQRAPYVPPSPAVVPASGSAQAHAAVKPVPASAAGQNPVPQSTTKAVKAAAHATGHSPAQVASATAAAANPSNSPARQFKASNRPAAALAKPRARYAGHADFNNLVRADWMRAIEDDPYAYDGLIYLPEVAEYTPQEQPSHEAALYTEINNNQRELTYGLPHPVIILDCPDERENFFAMDVDDNQDGYADEFLVIRVAATGIPIGSVFEWMEEQPNGSNLPRWWYVMRIFNYGTAAVGSLYFCVPARNFEGSEPQKGHIHA